MSRSRQPNAERDDLLGGYDERGRAPSSSRGYNRDELDGVDNQGLVQKQKDVMADQDKHLEVIEQSVLRSKEIAVAIGSEAKDQIKLVEELDKHVSATDNRIKNTTDRTKKVERKASNNIMLGTICTLIVILVVVIILAIFL